MDAVTLGAAKADAAKRYGQVARRPMPLGSRAQPQANVTVPLSDGVVLSRTYRTAHVALADIYDIAPVFSNFYNNLGTETDGPNPITVRWGLEYPVAALFPGFIRGRRDGTIEPGALGRADPVGVFIPKGSTFHIRTFVQVAELGMKWPAGGFLSSLASATGYDDAVDRTTSGTVTPRVSTRAYGPAAIHAIAATTPLKVLGVVGDSIASGSGDTDGDLGYIRRALNNNYPVQFVSYPSETVDGWFQQNGGTRYRRVPLLSPCTDVLVQLGVNSLTNAFMQDHLIAVWQLLANMGKRVWQTTITPKTNPDGSPSDATGETRRTTLNDYIRTTPTPLAGYFEIADLAETARNSGVWKPGYTDDYVHPNATGSAALAAGLTPATIFGS